MKNKNLFNSLKPALLWAFFILVLCTIPGKSLPHYTWADLLSVDKLIHCIIFLVLVVLIKKAFVRNSFLSPKKQNVITLAFAIPYGALLELMQTYCLVDRYGSWFDFMANSLGSFLGVLLFNRIIESNYLKH